MIKTVKIDQNKHRDADWTVLFKNHKLNKAADFKFFNQQKQ